MPKREQLEQMVQSNPDDLFLHYALAMACINEGDAEAGLERLQKVLDRDPDYVAAYFQKGQVLAERGETESARETVRKGIETARKVGDAHAEEEMTGFLEML